MRAPPTFQSDQRQGCDFHPNLSIDLSNAAICRTTCSVELVPRWLGIPADAGTGRPVQWQNARLAVQVDWILNPKNVEAVKGDVSPPNATVWFPSICWLNGQCSIRPNGTTKGSRITKWFIQFNLLCKVGEALVLDLHDIQHAPNTQLAETHFIVKWSNIFKNVCEICCLLWIQLASSVDCVDCCHCRTQTSVRLLEMLRRIVRKVKNSSDYPSVRNFSLKGCSSLALGNSINFFPVWRLFDDSGAQAEETEAWKWPWACRHAAGLAQWE